MVNLALVHVRPELVDLRDTRVVKDNIDIQDPHLIEKLSISELLKIKLQLDEWD